VLRDALAATTRRRLVAEFDTARGGSAEHQPPPADETRSGGSGP
jgi:hypothetical protein